MEELRLAFAFALVFGLLGLLYLFAGRSKGKFHFPWATVRNRLSGAGLPLSASTNESIRVARRLHLTPTHQLHIVLVGDQTLVLCTFPQGCQLLSTTGEPDHSVVPPHLEPPGVSHAI